MTTSAVWNNPYGCIIMTTLPSDDLAVYDDPGLHILGPWEADPGDSDVSIKVSEDLNAAVPSAEFT